jgi:hypothetical protein
MKSVFAFMTVLVLSSAVLAGPLDGKAFCRSVETGGIFGQPKGVRSHCVQFQMGRANDNANTFFGNPPEVFEYSLKGKVINRINRGSNDQAVVVPSGYEIKSKTEIVIAETQAVLTLTKAKAK